MAGQQDPGVGRRLGQDGHLVLRRRLGEGAAGAIWLAEDVREGTLVAVKFLLAGASAHDALVRRFTREGRRFGALRHDNLVRVLGLGEEGGHPYLVIEFVDGRSLWEILEGGQVFEPAVALLVARDIAAGLSAAHAAGVVHRDLKPANVMVKRADGHVKVLDFGIAKDLRSEDTAITRIGTYIGTPAYSAPEQILGDPVDHRTDVYSLGVILFELMCGPFTLDGRRTTELFRAALHERNIPLSDLHERVGRPVGRLVQKMTRRHPDRRPSDMEEVRATCDHLLGLLKDQGAAEDEPALRARLAELCAVR